MADTVITVRDLIERLARLSPDLEVWVEDGASVSGYSPVVGCGLGADPDPATGEPEEFAALFTG